MHYSIPLISSFAAKSTGCQSIFPRLAGISRFSRAYFLPSTLSKASHKLLSSTRDDSKGLSALGSIEHAFHR